MPQIKDLLLRGKQLLASVPSCALDASLLLAKASGLSREQLYSRACSELDEAQCGYYFELIERRRKGECTAYILGHKEFWGLEFTVSPTVLVPRPDTEILVEAALLVIRSIPNSGSPLSVLDLCTGSGVVAIALKHDCPGLEVTATDISEEALGVARKNAELLGCEITFLRGDLFRACTDNPKAEDSSKRRFCLITANAPYIPSQCMEKLPIEVRNEPRIALDGGDDGLALIRRVIAEAPRYLQAGGSLVLEADPSQMETIAGLMKDQGFTEPKLYQDLAGKNRVIAAEINALDHC